MLFFSVGTVGYWACGGCYVPGHVICLCSCSVFVQRLAAGLLQQGIVIAYQYSYDMVGVLLCLYVCV